MVPLLPVGHQCQHGLGVKVMPGQHTEQQHLYLRDGQAWGFFFNLMPIRTRKKWAKIQSVI
jgi:hypothetical protein